MSARPRTVVRGPASGPRPPSPPGSLAGPWGSRPPTAGWASGQCTAVLQGSCPQGLRSPQRCFALMPLCPRPLREVVLWHLQRVRGCWEILLLPPRPRKWQESFPQGFLGKETTPRPGVKVMSSPPHPPRAAGGTPASLPWKGIRGFLVLSFCLLH